MRWAGTGRLSLLQTIVAIGSVFVLVATGAPALRAGTAGVDTVGPSKAPTPGSRPASTVTSFAAITVPSGGFVPVPTYSGHYWLGAVYSGASTTAESLSVDINVPDDLPDGGVYFAILSAWDNAGSYDQVGLADYYGTFAVGYSTSSYCAATYYTNDLAALVSRGMSYQFAMTISDGTVEFQVRSASSGSLAFSTSVSTGGSEFLVSSTYSCNSETDAGYTDYEEVYSSPGPLVPYDFWFTDNDASGSAVTAWEDISAGGAPSAAEVVVSGDDVIIENEAFYLSFPPGGSGPMDTSSIETSSVSRTLEWGVSVTDLRPDNPISLEVSGVPAGWSVVPSPASGDPPFNSTLSIVVPAGEGSGSIVLEVNGTDSSGAYDTIALDIELTPGVSLLPSTTPSTGSVDIGQSLDVDAGVTGGVGPYTVLWVDLPAGCLAMNMSLISCFPNSPGTYSVTVEVIDSLASESSATLLCEVYSDPSVLLTQSSSSLAQGNVLTLSGSVSGGSGDYSYMWSGLPPGCTSVDGPTLSCKVAAAGNFSVLLTVHDSDGGLATASITVVVVSDEVGYARTLELLGLVLIPVVCLLVSVGVWRRRKGTLTSDEADSSFLPVASVYPVALDPVCHFCGTRMPEGSRYCGMCAVPLSPFNSIG